MPYAMGIYMIISTDQKLSKKMNNVTKHSSDGRVYLYFFIILRRLLA